MKLDFDQDPQALIITSYSSDGILIRNQLLTQAFVVHGDRILIDTVPAQVDDLTPGHVASIVDLGASIIIIGTGSAQQFLDHAVLRPALENAVGVETMETGAACRSYNVLVGENRAVAAIFYPII